MRADQHVPAGSPAPGVGAGAGGFDKRGLLAEYASRFHVRTLVETGLYQGSGSGMHVDVEQYVAIDWQAENVELARERRPDGEYLLGDSADRLERLLADHNPFKVEIPVLFWLDAHALDEAEGSPHVCPVLGELAAIAGWEHTASSVVLIDDLWGFGSLRGWPTLDELREHADAPAVWNRVEQDGVMRLTPR